MLNESQVNFVKRMLIENGEVTRNQCLKRYISRLAAIVHILNKEGWQVAGMRLKTGDYKYIPAHIPKHELLTAKHEALKKD